MKHVLYGDKSLLMGDDVADLLVEYAALLVDRAGADAVTLRAIGPDGNEVEVTLLIATGAVLSVETTNLSLRPPANEVPVQYLGERIAAIRHPPMVQPETPEDVDRDGDAESTL